MEVFPPRERRRAEAERQTARRSSKGHGRNETRTLITTTALNDYVDWPGVGQVFQLKRERTLHGQRSFEIGYGITSLPRELASAQQLLKLTRQHWGIENRVFWVRDVSLGEDGCRVRSTEAPLILSALRNAALNLLNWAQKAGNIAAALRRHAAHPHEALALIRGYG